MLVDKKRQSKRQKTCKHRALCLFKKIKLQQSRTRNFPNSNKNFLRLGKTLKKGRKASILSLRSRLFKKWLLIFLQQSRQAQLRIRKVLLMEKLTISLMRMIVTLMKKRNQCSLWIKIMDNQKYLKRSVSSLPLLMLQKQ
jgi:hypothetical protein